MARTCSLTQVSQPAVMNNNNCHLIFIMTNVCQQNQQQQQVSVIFIQSSCMALLAVTRGGRFWQSDSGAWISTIDDFGFPQLAILDFHNRRLSIHYCAACVELPLDFTVCHQVQQNWICDHHRQHCMMYPEECVMVNLGNQGENPAQCQINVKLG